MEIVSLYDEYEREYATSLSAEMKEMLEKDPVFKRLLQSGAPVEALFDYLELFRVAHSSPFSDSKDVKEVPLEDLDAEVSDAIWDKADYVVEGMDYEHWIYRKIPFPDEVNESTGVKLKELQEEVGDNLFVIKKHKT